MVKTKIHFFAWKRTKDQEQLIQRIVGVLEKEIGDVTIEPVITDLCMTGPMKAEKFTFVFGNKAKVNIEGDDFWLLPELKCLMPDGNKEKRLKAFEIIKHAAKEIKSKLSEPVIVEKEEEQLNLFAEKNNVTIGTNNTDIEVPPDILTYIKTMKDLLGNCKIIITKGEFKVEIE
jgi:hypothetical protein